jgi:hypothetical protein
MCLRLTLLAYLFVIFSLSFSEDVFPNRSHVSFLTTRMFPINTS